MLNADTQFNLAEKAHCNSLQVKLLRNVSTPACVIKLEYKLKAAWIPFSFLDQVFLTSMTILLP